VSVGGTRVHLTQETRYPWDGAVKLTLAPHKAATFTVRVRIPGWAHNQPVPTDLYRYADTLQPTVSLSVNGQPYPIKLDKGYVAVKRQWQNGDEITLDLPMPVRRVVADDRVADDAGRVAIERGPLVYCFEGCDNKDQVFHLVVPDDAVLEPQFRPDLLGGVTAISGKGTVASTRTNGAITTTSAVLTAIPYYAWCNRGAGQMQVWMPRTTTIINAETKTVHKETAK
jgi:hypothetical protein